MSPKTWDPDESARKTGHAHEIPADAPPPRTSMQVEQDATGKVRLVAYRSPAARSLRPDLIGREVPFPVRAMTPEERTIDERIARESDGPADAWGSPLPLKAARDLPAFPTDAFPPSLREFVEAEALATQTPVDMAALFALGSIATVSGGRARVEPVPGWVEGTNIFVTAVMEPGSRKSAVERDVKAPIVEHERALAEKERPNIAELASRRRVAEARRDRTEKAAGNAKPTDRFGLEQEAFDAARAVDEIVVPPLPRFFTADTTPEALGSLLAAHGGRMAVLSAEGGIFDLMAGRYSNGIPNLDVFLSGHAGDTLRVDRRNRPPEFVDRPALTMALAAQPFVLRKLGRNGEMTGRGLLDRFLYAVPVGNVGFRKSSPPPVPERVRELYASQLTTLANSLAPYDREPYVLRLEPDAVDALTAWREELEPRGRPRRDAGVGLEARWRDRPHRRPDSPGGARLRRVRSTNQQSHDGRSHPRSSVPHPARGDGIRPHGSRGSARGRAPCPAVDRRGRAPYVHSPRVSSSAREPLRARGRPRSGVRDLGRARLDSPC